MKGTARRDAAALQKAPSRKRAIRSTGEEEEQFKHVRPYRKEIGRNRESERQKEREIERGGNQGKSLQGR